MRCQGRTVEVELVISRKDPKINGLKFAALVCANGVIYRVQTRGKESVLSGGK